MTTLSSTKSAPLSITEDEAALYDRQIRLWGLEAQQRMRNATIMILRLQGVATEVVKNIVLAGIGKLIVVDGSVVSAQDLGAGFFFRDEDVGKRRVDAAKGRIESLNPLVTVETIPREPFGGEKELDSLLTGVDLLCVTEGSLDELIRLNAACRRNNKQFYAGGSYGLYGYIFCDLLDHGYLGPDRSAPTDAPRTIKMTVPYPTLREALKHRWDGLSRKQTRELNPAAVFTILGLWEYQAKYKKLPQDTSDADELESIINVWIRSSGVNKQSLKVIPRDSVNAVSTMAAHEFSPVCAVLGGMLAQDILKALAAKEPPIANFFTFDGTTGGGTVVRMGMS